MKHLPLALLAGATLGLGLAGCQPGAPKTDATTTAATLLTPGPWHAVLRTQGQEIPFLFEVKTEAGQPIVYLVNKGLTGEERLRCPEISAAGDSATIKLHVFDAALVVRADGAGQLKGNWVKYDAKGPYRVPLTATAGARKLFVPSPTGQGQAFAGKWAVTFTGDDGKPYPAIGVFQQLGHDVTGTFLTNTGDYRYLAGQTVGDQLKMSTFDGGHGFLYVATKASPTQLKGDFYSGKSGHETWTATKDDHAKLPDSDTLTYLKKGESRLSFTFPSIFQGSSISPTAAKYRGKVLVLQVLGSWCPNCMDETAFLAPWYDKNKQRGVEIIGLGYERSAEYDQAAPRIRKLKDRYHIGYDLAVAGVSNKDSVAKSLPQLAKFLAFPTTVFIDKKGVVRKIHTGFSGPGTGKYYAEETKAFNQEIDKLLKE